MMKANRKIIKSKTINYNKHLDNKYGKLGTESRDAFIEESNAYYYGELLRDRRKQLKLSQAELAQKIGKTRPYISQVENGRDLQLSNLVTIANALKMSIKLVPH